MERRPPSDEAAPPLTRGAARLLAALAAASLAGALLCALGWSLAVRRTRPAGGSLGVAEREALVAEMFAVSPGVYAPALYEPAIGYTLVPGKRIRAWNDDFVVNEIGYRAGPLAKSPGTVRVLFLGDSWTFGLGVREAQAFPARTAALAQERGAAGRVESWSLALPGYNAWNELAALWFFFDRLRPDAVVLCPTMNDVDSTAAVLANGSLGRGSLVVDGFSDRRGLAFRPSPVDSHLYRQRWRDVFAAARDTEERLRALEVPLLVYFAATWNEAMAHALVHEAGLESPYVVTPARYTVGDWRNPPPLGHGTREAQRVYARLVYAGLAEVLGWPAPPPGEEPAPQVHRRAADGSRWSVERDLLLRERTRGLAEGYVPGPEAEGCAGWMDCATGVAGRSTVVQVRRGAGARALEVTVERLPDAPSLLPLEVTVTVPAADGVTQERLTLTADGPERATVQVPLPEGIAEGAAVDVLIDAARAVADLRALAGRSLRIVSIEQR